MSKRQAGPSDYGLFDYGPGKRARVVYNIDELYKKITVDKDDKSDSKQLVDETLASLMDHIRNKQTNGKLYDHRIVKAGSHAINAKIGKADEFDTNVLLNIRNVTFRTSEGINYMFDDCNSHNMRQKLSLRRTPIFNVNDVPSGYAIVEVGEYQDNEEIDIRLFKHFDNNFRQINISSRGKTELIPRDIKRDFHTKIWAAIYEIGLNESVKLDDAAHGPALTLKFSPGRKVTHKVDVDLTLSLKIALEFEKFKWPRDATLKAFSKEKIDDVLDAGIHLVPKKDLFWSISFSRAERALLSGIDADNGCRKMVLKILKYLLEECKRISPSQLNGMSSHILKTQVLWSCEKHANEIHYWNRGNRLVCLMNTRTELIFSLRNKHLPDYFNTAINVLAGKIMVGKEFADFMSGVEIVIE